MFKYKIKKGKNLLYTNPIEKKNQNKWKIGIIIKKRIKTTFCMLNLRCLSVLSIRYKKQKQQKIKIKIEYHNFFLNLFLHKMHSMFEQKQKIFVWIDRRTLDSHSSWMVFHCELFWDVFPTYSILCITSIKWLILFHFLCLLSSLDQKQSIQSTHFNLF